MDDRGLIIAIGWTAVGIFLLLNLIKPPRKRR